MVVTPCVVQCICTYARGVNRNSARRKLNTLTNLALWSKLNRSNISTSDFVLPPIIKDSFHLMTNDDKFRSAHDDIARIDWRMPRRFSLSSKRALMRAVISWPLNAANFLRGSHSAMSPRLNSRSSVRAANLRHDGHTA